MNDLNQDVFAAVEAARPVTEVMSRSAFTRLPPAEAAFAARKIALGALVIDDTLDDPADWGRRLQVKGFSRISRDPEMYETKYHVLTEGGVERVLTAPDLPDLPDHAIVTPSKLAQKALEVLGVLDVNRRLVPEEKTLSPAQRQVKLAKVTEDVNASLAEVRKQLDERITDLHAAFDRAYSPPKIENDDLRSELKDREIRDVLRAKGTNAFALVTGDPEVAASVLRFPKVIDGRLVEQATRVWRAHIDETDANIPRLKASEVGLGWSLKIVSQAQELAAVRG